MSRLAQSLTVLGCVCVVLVAAAVQLVVVLGLPISAERLIVPVLVGATFGTLIVALVRARAALRASLQAVAEQRREIAALNQRLSVTVRSQGHELKTAERRLVESDRLGAVGLLASGMAHDFNNLLTVVLSGSAYLLGGSAGEQKEVVEGMMSAGERGATLTRQLLALARPAGDTSAVECLNRAVEALESLFRRLVGNGVVVDVSRCPGDLPVSLGRGFLEQVLVNLVVNAHHAMPSGGTLTLTTRRLGQSAVLTVRDTGTGMSPEVQARIFEPFFTTREGRGTGLGLAVVMDAMRRGGGQISVDSKVGEGATFALTFPLAELGLAEVTPPATSHPKGHHCILFVDEEPSVRHLTSTVLERLGYEVTACAGQAAALVALDAFIASGRPVALVTDLLLGDGDGHTLVHEAKKRAPLVPAVVTSSFGLPEPAGGAVPLAKPYTAAGLLAALEKAGRSELC